MLLFSIRTSLRLANWPLASSLWLMNSLTESKATRLSHGCLSGVAFYLIYSRGNVCKKHFYPQCHQRNGILWVNNSMSVANFGRDSPCCAEMKQIPSVCSSRCLCVSCAWCSKVPMGGYRVLIQSTCIFIHVFWSWRNPLYNVANMSATMHPSRTVTKISLWILQRML